MWMARNIMRLYQLAGSVYYSQVVFSSRWGVRTRGIGEKGGASGTLQYVRGKYVSLKATNLTVLARGHPFRSPARYCFLS